MIRGDRIALLLDRKHAARQAEVASQPLWQFDPPGV
jgi:hypothetical protein